MPKGSKYNFVDLLLEMTRYCDELGRAPTVAEVDARSKEGKMASAATYKKFFCDGEESWSTVIETCGYKLPPGRKGRASVSRKKTQYGKQKKLGSS